MRAGKAFRVCRGLYFRHERETRLRHKGPFDSNALELAARAARSRIGSGAHYDVEMGERHANPSPNNPAPVRHHGQAEWNRL